MKKNFVKKTLKILNSKPVIGIGIFIMLSLAMVFAGNVFVKEGSMSIDEKVGIGTSNPADLLEVEYANSIISTPGISIDSSGSQSVLGFRNSGNLRAYLRADGNGNLILVSQGGANNNIYFRAGSDSGAPLFISGSSGNIGIGTSSPNSALQVNGPIATPITTITSTYTVTASDSVVVCTSSYYTVNLPTASGIEGRQYTIKRAWNNEAPGSIIVDPYSTQTIDGSSTYQLNDAGDSVIIASDGSNWIIVGGIE